ncbi:hypothetical protein [Halorussus caseinilyticus]|uniref:hypothetical protein n=1 Tax=Halorussus caseinilyticus TaxID=3034025 RepID=UPI0023E8BA70|nr:hypothetical protein [Halorussus sp. DT72]
MNRRRFLQTTAAVFGTAVVGAGAAAATGEGPITATGRRIHRFVPDGDTYRHEDQFVSSDLVGRYGDEAVSFETERVPRKAVPGKHKNPDRAFTRTYRETVVVGAPEEHAAAERAERERLQSDDVSTSGVSTDSQPYYYGPLYVYKDGDQLVRTGPINVGWRRYLGMDAGEVDSKMYNQADWNGYWEGFAGDRYVLLDNGTTMKKQDVHASKPTGLSSQWHGRLYNLPTDESDDYAVVCQAHHDPECHCYSDWDFADSRRKFLDVWDSNIDDGYYLTDNVDVYNGTGYSDDESSNGLFGVVY